MNGSSEYRRSNGIEMLFDLSSGFRIGFLVMLALCPALHLSACSSQSDGDGASGGGGAVAGGGGTSGGAPWTAGSGGPYAGSGGGGGFGGGGAAGTQPVAGGSGELAVDIVILVDNSGTMGEEQKILTTQFFNLVNALVDPPTPPECGVVEDVRIGIITSDLGLQSGEARDLPVPHPFPAQCLQYGDDALFRTYTPGFGIDIQPSAIRCNAPATQCPSGWTCDAIDSTGVGSCIPPAGSDGSGQPCPDMGAAWIETAKAAPNPSLAFQAACLAVQGTGGCLFEQQLKGLAAAPTANAGFLREDALLALIAVSDEEDCSVGDVAFFYEPDVAQGLNMNMACQKHPDRLFLPEYYYDRFLQLKGGDINKVVFAGIVGVPVGPTCEGLGNAIGGCLDDQEMQLVEAMLDTVHLDYRPACERFVPPESTETTDRVTKAAPGRRYVELAQRLGDRGLISSICNEDWERVMREIAKLITCSIIIE